MGCWHETCGFTNAPITDGEPVRLMAIRRVPDKDARTGDTSLFGAFDLFHPVTILARGTYNDYGWIDFAEGEEARFFNSALSVGSGLQKQEDDNPEFPPHHYQWMIREDAFAMINDIPLDSWSDKMPKTVGEGVTMKRDRAKVLRSLLREADPMSTDSNDFQLREEYNEIFGRGEMPHWPLKRELHTYIYRDMEKSETDEVLDQKLEDLLDIWKVFVGLNDLRKILSPTNGAGSQRFNDDGYLILAKYYENVAKKWTDYLDN